MRTPCDLPDELLFRVYNFLGRRDLLPLRGTSKRLRDSIDEDRILWPTAQDAASGSRRRDWCQKVAQFPTTLQRGVLDLPVAVSLDVFSRQMADVSLATQAAEVALAAAPRPENVDVSEAVNAAAKFGLRLTKDHFLMTHWAENRSASRDTRFFKVREHAERAGEYRFAMRRYIERGIELHPYRDSWLKAAAQRARTVGDYDVLVFQWENFIDARIGEGHDWVLKSYVGDALANASRGSLSTVQQCVQDIYKKLLQSPTAHWAAEVSAEVAQFTVRHNVTSPRQSCIELAQRSVDIAMGAERKRTMFCQSETEARALDIVFTCQSVGVDISVKVWVTLIDAKLKDCATSTKFYEVRRWLQMVKRCAQAAGVDLAMQKREALTSIAVQWMQPQHYDGSSAMRDAWRVVEDVAEITGWSALHTAGSQCVTALMQQPRFLYAEAGSSDGRFISQCIKASGFEVSEEDIAALAARLTHNLRHVLLG